MKIEKSIRDKLETPFDPRFIETRKGTNGKSLSYLGGAQYIQRMNDCAEGGWSYRIIDRFSQQRPGTSSSGKTITDIVVLVEVDAIEKQCRGLLGTGKPQRKRS